MTATKKIALYSIMAAAAFMATACDESWEPVDNSGKDGSVRLGTLAIGMPDADKVQTVVSNVSRASFDTNSFIVTVTDLTGAKAPQTWTYGEMPEVLTLPAGDYRLKIESHNIKPTAWEEPYYLGTKDFSVQQGRITQIGAVNCNFASLKVTVRFDEAILPRLGADSKVTVFANENAALEYSTSETRSGYFDVSNGVTSLIARFEGTIDGMHVSYETPFTDVQPGQHRIISYYSKSTPTPPEQTGTVDPSGVGIDASVVNVNISSNITVGEEVLPSEDRPGQEGGSTVDPKPDPDPDPTPGEKAATFKPSASSTNLSLTEINELTPATADSFGDAIVEIACAKGIKNLVVNIQTDSQDFLASLSDLAMDQPFDLANPGADVLDNIVGLGLPNGDQVKGKNLVNFDITGFVPMMTVYAGTHSFVLTVTDASGAMETMTMRFRITK